MEARGSAVNHGLAFLAQFIEEPEHLHNHWGDYLLETTNMICTGSESVRHHATLIQQQVTAAVRDNGIRIDHDASLSDCWKFSVAALCNKLQSIDPTLSQEKLLTLTRQASTNAHITAWQTAQDELDFYKFCTRNLISGYIAYHAGTVLGHGLAESFDRAISLRPYSSYQELSHEGFVYQGFVITHVVYAATQYNRVKINPAHLIPERDAMLLSLRELMNHQEFELLGEYLDALRSCGIAQGDPRWLEAASWLCEHQNRDGSWGDINEENSYKRYHVTMAAVQGLRDYHNQGSGESGSCTEFLLRRHAAKHATVNSPSDYEQEVNEPVSVFNTIPQSSLLTRLALESRPAIFEAAGKQLSAYSKWNNDYLNQTIGNIKLEVEVSDDRVFAHPDRSRELRTVSIKEYLAQQSSCEWYLAQTPLEGALQGLEEDIEIDPWLPQSIRCDKKLWMSSGERITPLHFDREHNLFIQLKGHKRFTLFSPQQHLLLYPHQQRNHFSQIDIANPDLQRFPNFVHATPLVIDLGPGDVLFLPMYWWHHVESYGESLAVSCWWQGTAINNEAKADSKKDTNKDALKNAKKHTKEERAIPHATQAFAPALMSQVSAS